MRKDCETRACLPLEVRAAEGDGVKVYGYAAVFGQDANIGDMFIERFERGAFSETLKRKAVRGAQEDIVFVLNHSDSLLLARTRSGTLLLREDDHGLYMESELDPIDPDAVRVVRKMARGDLDKMSFVFFATRQEWAERPDQLPMRTVRQAELFDVSVVTDPAYIGTEIGLRSLADFRALSVPIVGDAAAKAALARMRMKHRQHTGSSR